MTHPPSRPRAVVVGSVNVDHVATVSHLAQTGETVLASGYAVYQGGKGANQAVALARAGADVAIVAHVGADDDGHFVTQSLLKEGVDVRFVRAISGVPTGKAFIQVSNAGENSICVVTGANTTLDAAALPGELIASADMILLQGELPPATIHAAATAGAGAGATVVLNLAPWHPLPANTVAAVTVLVVNETEAAQQLNVPPSEVRADPLAAARKLSATGPASVLTLGDQGVAWCDGLREGRLPAHTVEVVDTTGAGDAFVGNLAAALLDRRTLANAVTWANAAGALATTVAGATPSIPHRDRTAALVEHALHPAPLPGQSPAPHTLRDKEPSR
jgi:ribokinase